MISSSQRPLPDNTRHSQQISAGERPAAAHLLKSWVRIPRGAWIFVCCDCRVLSGRGLCDELITHPEESYRLCCVVVCDLETSRMDAPYIYDISRLRVNHIGLASERSTFRDSLDMCPRRNKTLINNDPRLHTPLQWYCKNGKKAGLSLQFEANE